MSTENLNWNTLKVGDVVRWADPDRGLSSGVYVVQEVMCDEDDDRTADTMVSIRSEAGSWAEVYISELSPTNLAQYAMEVCRTSHRFLTVNVIAESFSDAEEKALEAAQSTEFGPEKTAQHEVVGGGPIDE